MLFIPKFVSTKRSTQLESARTSCAMRAAFRCPCAPPDFIVPYNSTNLRGQATNKLSPAPGTKPRQKQVIAKSGNAQIFQEKRSKIHSKMPFHKIFSLTHSANLGSRKPTKSLSMQSLIQLIWASVKTSRKLLEDPLRTLAESGFDRSAGAKTVPA